MKILLIANPISGGRRGGQRVEGLLHALEQRGHAVDLRWTRGPGDATRLARDAAADLDRLVVAGGDGTLNEVVNGLRDPAALPLAQLPLGTANLIGHEFDLPRDPEMLAGLVEAGHVRRIDLARADGRRFLCVASCGFDAMVTAEIRRTRAGKLGYRGYLRPILRTLRHYVPPRLEVTIDGGPPLAAALVVVSNVRNYGGLFSVTDRALPDSGVLDVCVFPSARIVELVGYVLAGLRRRVSRLPGVIYRCGKHIGIQAEVPVPVQVDGDHWGTTPVAIDVLPAALPLLVPPPDAAA